MTHRDGDFDVEIVEDVWDCTSCSTKGIQGREIVCPNCGNAFDGSEKYRDGDQREVNDPELLKMANAGPNWRCAFCEQDNRANHDKCSHDGAPKEELKSTAQREQEYEDQLLNFKLPPVQERLPNWAVSQLPMGLFAFFVFFGFLIYAFQPTYENVQLRAASWRRVIHLEELAPHVEECWDTPPPGGTVLSSWVVPDGGGQETRIVGYRPDVRTWQEQVSDGYTTTYDSKRVQTGTRAVSRTVRIQTGTRRVLDHSERLKNGFTKNFYKNEPVYGPTTKTEYEPVYEIVQVPRQIQNFKMVNRSEPIMVPMKQSFPVPRTRVKYQISTWSPTAGVETSGTDLSPKWGDVVLAGPYPRREGTRDEFYKLYFKGTERQYDYVPRNTAEFSGYKIGAFYRAKIVVGGIREIQPR